MFKSTLIGTGLIWALKMQETSDYINKWVDLGLGEYHYKFFVSQLMSHASNERFKITFLQGVNKGTIPHSSMKEFYSKLLGRLWCLIG